MLESIIIAIILILLIFAVYLSIKFLINKIRDIEQLKRKMENLERKDTNHNE